MTLRAGMATFDSSDPRSLAHWWAHQTGGRVLHDADGVFVMVGGRDAPISLGFQFVEQPTPGKNRIHLDFSASDREAEVERLIDAGATFVARHDEVDNTWVVLADPDGNEFCVSAG